MIEDGVSQKTVLFTLHHTFCVLYCMVTFLKKRTKIIQKREKKEIVKKTLEVVYDEV